MSVLSQDALTFGLYVHCVYEVMEALMSEKCQLFHLVITCNR